MVQVAVAGRAALFSALANVAGDLREAFVPGIDQIRGILSRYTDRDGVIPLEYQGAVQVEVGDVVQRLYVGSDMRNAFDRDGVTALSPYATVLNLHLVQSQAKVVEGHETYMNRVLRNEPDIRHWLQSVAVRQQADQPLIREIRSNPLAKYEPAHTWVDPNGYRLSDRIWQTSVNTRLTIDRMVASAIQEGLASRDLARILEASLLPGRKSIRTRRPYNRDASFDAMRLARSEIARAHSEATFAAAYGDPFVDGMDWRLSAQHPRDDICDRLATIGMSGERLKDPYPLDDAPQVVKDSHPMCICTNVVHPAADNVPAVDELRAMMDRGQQPPLTPLAYRAFTLAMMGFSLYSLLHRS